jgi:hypothetical protein
MLIEEFKRIDGWLNIRINPIDNQSLYDFSFYDYENGKDRTISEAHELYQEYLKYIERK